MISSRRPSQDQGPGVNLFPFLAVLLCTMGMLIMLLVLISRDTADREPEQVELAAAENSGKTDALDQVDPLFSSNALEEFGELSARKSASDSNGDARDEAGDADALPEPAAEAMDSFDSEDLLVNEEELAENTTEEPEPPDGMDGANESGEPAEVSEENALYEEYLKQYGEMNEDEIRFQKEGAEWFLEELKGIRERTKEELDAQRRRLSESEAAIGKLVAQLVELNAKAADLAKEPGGKEEDEQKLDDEISAKVAEIEELNKSIEELKKKSEDAGKKPTYAILPYRGKAGTFRRPIYIECDGDGIRLMPERVQFLPEDFLLARYPGNPFDAGLRAARQYYIEKGQGSGDSEPYPLLILKPEAAQKYYVAKSALASWGGEFGYEFVESDSEIEYPKPDPELRRRVEEQVAMARVKLAGPLAALMNELEAEGKLSSDEYADAGEYADGSGSGGFGDSNGLPGKETGGFGSGGEADGPIPLGGIGGRLGPYAKLENSNGNGTAIPFNSGTNRVPGIGSGMGGKGTTSPSGGFNGVGGIGSTGGISSAGKTGTLGYAGLSTGSGSVGGGMSAMRAMEDLDPDDLLGNEITTVGGVTNSMAKESVETASYAGDEAGNGSAHISGIGGYAPAHWEAGYAARPNATGKNDSGMDDPGLLADASAIGEAPGDDVGEGEPDLEKTISPGSESDRKSVGSAYVRNSAQGAGKPSSTSSLFADTARETDKADTDGPEIDVRETVGNTAYLRGTEGDSVQAGMAPAPEARMAAGGGKQSGKMPKPKEPKVKAERDKREINLAEELKKPSQMAVERPVSVECVGDKIVFARQPGMRTAKELKLESREDAREVLETVVYCVRSWKAAGRNMYWSPWIKAKVEPGGDVVFRKLQRLMESQGVRIEGTR